jgi:hypothetical protein
MPDFFSLSARGFTTTVLIAGGGVTPAEGVGCPSELPATAIVMTPADVADGSVPAVSTEPAAGTSSQQMWSQPYFGAWGRVGKKKDCNTDKVSIQQTQDLIILQDSDPIPGGFDYVCFTLAHHPMTPRD